MKIKLVCGKQELELTREQIDAILDTVFWGRAEEGQSPVAIASAIRTHIVLSYAKETEHLRDRSFDPTFDNQSE